METFGTILVAKNGNKVANKYVCEKCDYTCIKKYNWDKHIITAKHIKKTMEAKMEIKNSKKCQSDMTCECGKSYKNKSGLWKHQKKCNYKENNSVTLEEPEENVINNTMIVELLKQNNEFKELIIEQNKKILELVNNSNVTNITNNNNTTNNKFNLNVFLNEKCKDALNLTDFISNLNVGFSDFENFGKIGYSNSISHIFIRGLKELDVYKRPIHCSDLKREVIHVKDDNTWKKDDEKEQMIKAIKMIEHKNIKQIPDWIKAHPAHADIRSKKFDEYSKMLDQSMGEYEDEDNQKNYQKIIRSVAKEILVEKDS